MVVRRILSLKHRDSLANDSFAILYRTNAQSRVFEEVLRKNGVPYRIYGGLSFYQRKEVKDVIAYFRMAVNPHDEEAFKRIINYPARGIGDTTVGKVLSAASDHGVSLWTVIGDPAAYNLTVNKGTITKLTNFYNLVSRFIEKVGKVDAYELGRMVVQEAGIMTDLMQDTTVEGRSRLENVQELMDGMHDFVRSRQEEGEEAIGLPDFLSDVALLTDQDSDDDDTDKVTLMTVHAAKGLEFDTVFIVGMEEQLFPSMMAYDSARQMEEERRLLYVAVTRAEKRCFLSYAKSRFRYGKVEYGMPSRFLKDIDAGYMECPKVQKTFMGSPFRDSSPSSRNIGGISDKPRFMSERTTQSTQNSRGYQSVHTPQKMSVIETAPTSRRLVSASAGGGASRVAQLTPGQHIEHERFGVGEVIKVEGTGENTKALIRFENAGDKQLLLKFARFRVLG